jgi:proteasome alpha subunit
MYQVEYAREAVKKGSISVGMVYKDGVILMVEKRVPSSLAVSDSVEKIFRIENNIACSTSGLIADSRILVDYAREEFTDYAFRYSEDMPVIELVKRVCNIKRIYTQYGGVRPFGVSFLFGGIDNDGISLYETDPSGAYKKYCSGAIGEGKADIEQFFENKYKDDMDLKSALSMIFEAMEKVLDRNVSDMFIEMVTITKKDLLKKYSDIEIEDLKAFFQKNKDKENKKIKDKKSKNKKNKKKK